MYRVIADRTVQGTTYTELLDMQYTKDAARCALYASRRHWESFGYHNFKIDEQ